MPQVDYNQVESCVVCGEDTPYKFGDNINYRNFYVEGAGQVCETCYKL